MVPGVYTQHERQKGAGTLRMSFFHRHIWKVERWNQLQFERGWPKTVTLEQCSKCGKLRTKSYDGLWAFDKESGRPLYTPLTPKR